VPVYVWALFATVLIAAALPLALLAVGQALGPQRRGRVKEMPYESGMDPVHDTRRRFDVRFHLVAIAFLVFDVELLFLYPWAVATRPAVAAETAAAVSAPAATGGLENPPPLPAKPPAQGIDAAVEAGLVSSRDLVFGEAMIFIALLGAGYVYALRRGVFRWR
jgi:NADH-quinone oxidoreductase subunit A